MKAVIVATTNNRSEWVKNCLDSLNGYTRYPIIVLNQYSYELGKVRWVLENTDLDEFILLQDSVEVKDLSLLDRAFDHSGSVSFATQPFFMYLGKYTRKALKASGVPQVDTKTQAVKYEREWGKRYFDSDPQSMCLFELEDTDVYEDFLGRKNMILENDFIKKYKHIWNPNMIYDY